MAEKEIKARYQHAVHTTSEWTSLNPVLKNGEIVIDSTVKRTKTGNGTSTWADLPYDDQSIYDHISTAATTSVLGHVKVDSSISSTSTNPVQNKAISAALSDKSDSGHKHSTDDITSGTLSTDRLPTVSVSKGGTGLTTIASGQALIGNGTGNITTRSIDTTSGGTSGSTSLITSGAVYSGLATKSSTGHTHNYAGSSSAGGAANSVANSLTIKLNGGSTEGTNLFTFNGSNAKSINVTPSSIGAAASSHNHSTDNITSGTLASDRLPVVPVSKGGTGLSTVTAGSVLVGNGTSAFNTRSIDTTAGGTSGSTSLITSGAVFSGVSSKLSLSGGTMGGTAMISWPDTGNWNNSNTDVTFPVKRGGLKWSGQSDGIEMYAEETANDNLDLVFKFTDDNSNGISIRNKAGEQTARISAGGQFTGTFSGTYNGYTLAAACAKSVTDSSSASAIGTGTSLVTERDVYYGLPSINNSHAYTSSTTIYAPTAGGTLGYELIGNGTTSAPTWKAPSYGSCSTEAATAAKVVNCTGFKLYTGAQITIKFTVTNTAANPTLNVNGTGAKSIYYRGGAISAGYLAANRTYTFMYNGTQYELVGDLDTNSDYKVTQTNTTTNADYRVLFSINANDNNETNSVRKSANLKFNPSTGNLTATKFTGSLAGNASSASQVYSTDTNPSSGTSYRIAFHADSSSGNKSILNNDGLKYYTLEGTTSAVGSAELGLGNSVASGTAGNKVGKIYLYGTSSGYTYIVPGYNSTGSVTITLPSSSGTLSLNGHEHNYYTLKGTNTISSTANDTTANWSDQKNSVHWYNTAGYLNSQPTTYGFLLNYSMSTDIHQIWLAQSGGNIYHRGGNVNGWASEWRIVLDSNNYASTLNGAYVRYTNANGYPGFNINGDDSSWIRTTSTGIIPYQAGTRYNGHCHIGTESFYFAYAYVDNIFTNNIVGTVNMYNGGNQTPLYITGYASNESSIRYQYSGLSNAWIVGPGAGVGSFDYFGFYDTDVKLVAKLHKGGEFTTNGEVRAGLNSANAFRAVYGNYGFIIRNDGTNTYLMTTASGDPYGSWNKYIIIANSNCATTFPANITISSGDLILNNGWIYLKNNMRLRTYDSSGTGANLIHWSSDNRIYIGEVTTKATKIRICQTCSNIGVLNSSGSWVTITTGVSDIREKNSIEDLQKSKEIVMGLKPKRFKFNDPEDDRYHLGFIAQDVRKTLDATIGDCAILEYNNTDPDEIRPVDRNDEHTFTYSMRYNEIIPPHVALTQEHEREIETLKSENQSLRDELKELKDMVQKLIA